jgi:hypothetical protein
MPRALILLALVAIAALAGCADNPPAAAPPPSTVTAAANPNMVECSNVERAYNAWKWTPSSSMDFTDFNVRRLMEKGEDFYKAVEGYKGAATALALEIARYNFDVATLNASYAAVGSAPGELSTRIVDGVGKINGAYAAWRYETCR